MEVGRSAGGDVATAEEVVRPEAPPMTFRANARRIAFNSLLMFVAAAAAAGLVARIPFGLALVAGLSVALAYYAVAWGLRVGSYGIRVDAEGVHRLDPRGRTTIAWGDLYSIDLAETPVRVRERAVRLRYIVLESRGPERILFADLSALGSPSVRIDLDGPKPITDVADSGVLLAVLADRTDDERYLPGVLMEHPRVPAAADAAPPAVEGSDSRESGERRRISVGALLALAAKLGSTFAKGIPLALKAFKPGLVLASAALTAVLFTWQFAVGITVSIVVHELGHVLAMRHAGLRIRGVYFIPMIGAATVPEDLWRTRREQAVIALAGPLTGLAFTALVAVLDAATGYAYPLLGVLVSWGALLNLLNLLPINPLDGGRVLSAIGYSLSTGFGVAVSIVVVVVALLLAWALDITLLAIVGAMGLFDFAGQTLTTLRFRRIAASPRVARLSPTGLATLKGLARPSISEEADQAYFELERRQATHLRDLGRVVPMTGGQMVRWGLAYVIITAALLALLIVSAGTHADASLAREILR
ncbi:MAG: hypothetical protein HY905_21015 [Deltaproteobacteria bacterium]|nr:hypothetical protein [Deltaproteobacteria bacterium]